MRRAPFLESARHLNKLDYQTNESHELQKCVTLCTLVCKKRPCRMYACIGAFGSVQDVRELFSALKPVNIVRIRALEHVITNASVGSRLGFLEDLWVFCNGRWKAAFSRNFVGAVKSNNVKVFEWMVAHDICPRGYKSDSIIFGSALYFKCFNVLDWVHSLMVDADKITGSHARTLKRWIRVYKSQRRTKTLENLHEPARHWLETHLM